MALRKKSTIQAFGEGEGRGSYIFSFFDEYGIFLFEEFGKGKNVFCEGLFVTPKKNLYPIESPVQLDILPLTPSVLSSQSAYNLFGIYKEFFVELAEESCPDDIDLKMKISAADKFGERKLYFEYNGGQGEAILRKKEAYYVNREQFHQSPKGIDILGAAPGMVERDIEASLSKGGFKRIGSRNGKFAPNFTNGLWYRGWSYDYESTKFAPIIDTVNRRFSKYDGTPPSFLEGIKQIDLPLSWVTYESESGNADLVRVIYINDTAAEVRRKFSFPPNAEESVDTAIYEKYAIPPDGREARYDRFGEVIPADPFGKLAKKDKKLPVLDRRCPEPVSNVSISYDAQLIPGFMDRFAMDNGGASWRATNQECGFRLIVDRSREKHTVDIWVNYNQDVGAFIMNEFFVPNLDKVFGNVFDELKRGLDAPGPEIEGPKL